MLATTPRTGEDLREDLRPIGRLRRGSAVHRGASGWQRVRMAAADAKRTGMGASAVFGDEGSSSGASLGGGATGGATSKRGAGGECLATGPLASMGGDVMLTGGFKQYFRSLGGGSSYGGTARSPRGAQAPAGSEIGRYEPNQEAGGWFGASVLESFHQSVKGLFEPDFGGKATATAGDGGRDESTTGASAINAVASAPSHSHGDGASRASGEHGAQLVPATPTLTPQLTPRGPAPPGDHAERAPPPNKEGLSYV